MRLLALTFSILTALCSVHGCGAGDVVLATTTVTPAQLAGSAWMPRANYGHRLEPANAVLHGAGQSDTESFVAYTAAMPPTARPMLFMSYTDLRDDLPGYFARLRTQLGTLPQFALPQIGLSLNAGDAAKHYEASVAAGDYDPQLDQLCAGLKSLGRPVYLRPGYEFNGPWNGYTPVAYVAAFRRIAAHVRACGLTNVALIWDINAGAAGNGAASPDAMRAAWQRFYPGDDVVDWWGINLFPAADLTSVATSTFLADAAKHAQPVMVAESTSQHSPASGGQATVDAWFAPYFGLLRSQPGIKAFCYIDWDWAQYPQWADWGDDRVESDPAVLAFYRSQVVAPGIASARTQAATLALVRAR